MLAFLLTLVASARADTWYLETAPATDRAAAARLADVAGAAGQKARVVKRFRLGHGWEFVVLVEGFASESAAADAQTRLGTSLGGALQAFRLDEGQRAGVAVPAPATAAAVPPPGAPDWLARARAAHGGATGGAAALARAAAVHFVFDRKLTMDGKEVVVTHDYWREGAARRLAVDTHGGGQDSVAIGNADGAWMVVGGKVESRDLGVLISAIDAFAPEAVLTAALEVDRLLAGPEVAHFRRLEGAEGVVRVGAGVDEEDPGLSFVDLDPVSGRVVAVRYISDGGPIRLSLSGYRDVAPGVLVPARVSIARADGRREEITVRTLDVPAKAASGVFAKPG